MHPHQCTHLFLIRCYTEKPIAPPGRMISVGNDKLLSKGEFHRRDAMTLRTAKIKNVFPARRLLILGQFPLRTFLPLRHCG